MISHDPHTSRLAPTRPITVAILAMGGQGGGVLADWIVATAESVGWYAQSTSVPGVAQRTGATIYYIETMPPKDGRPPILALMPTPGDVDIVLTAELMEGGRSILRGLVTPERTTLITSTHRAYAVAEKEKPGDGTGDPLVVSDAAGVAARRVIAFDMQALAEKHGSMISAAMFGALAASGALPFPRDAYEAVIRAGGKGIEASLRTFADAYDRAVSKPSEPLRRGVDKELPGLPEASSGHPELDRLVDRIRREFPDALHPMVFAGVRRLVDWQDPAYADEYLDRLAAIRIADAAAGGDAGGFRFTLAAAKYLAVAMAYDDVIRVADLKTRASRFARVKAEVGVGEDQIVYTTEFMHPRMEEVAGTLPRRLGEWIEARPRLFAALNRLVNRGRRVRTGTIRWFLPLYALAGMRRMRRSTLRHAREMDHIAAWLGLALDRIGRDYDLAVEIINTRRLVKGYSDTHARGTSKFERVLATLPLIEGRPDAADWLRRLRQAALIDEDGIALDGAIRTVESLDAAV
ncbi:indolepyruvate ferredoxin oxidoreductase beta subunit [Tepidamorphus gemmatus]|uniref:Indolepyruvate ferredoxin oxidoreductase beta subunit n=1 Tax=Tepidamorphus gemmatus TaxID=747076 RepID=A0A4R3M839_9HYPH|nr:indolepyruvate oxidoreductase subunit beta family protein [Tepidamorphus gemmatus]TCT09262.1 indolepyruvate ferredoxin oxidoreductase beta subunit [Tepidamorphus gemmatus]